MFWRLDLNYRFDDSAIFFDRCRWWWLCGSCGRSGFVHVFIRRDSDRFIMCFMCYLMAFGGNALRHNYRKFIYEWMSLYWICKRSIINIWFFLENFIWYLCQNWCVCFFLNVCDFFLINLYPNECCFILLQIFHLCFINKKNRKIVNLILYIQIFSKWYIDANKNWNFNLYSAHIINLITNLKIVKKIIRTYLLTSQTNKLIKAISHAFH